MHSYAIRLKFNASNYVMDCEALLAGLAASTNQDMKDLYVFIDSLTLVAQVPNHTPPKNSEPKSRSVNRIGNYKAGIPQPRVSVGIKTRPSVKEVRSSKKGKAASNAPRAEPNYNHESSKSN
ncbi:reverse transcriptase domain-containing protein [Tanacetum coccineum]